MLKVASFMLFRKYAKRSGRMKETDLIDDNHGLLEKLRLYEGSYLKRAAALLPHPDPEKYVTGAFIKHESRHYLRRHPTDRNFTHTP